MLRNYLVVAVRALRRQKGYAALNVAGLAVGLACSFLILFWVQDELRYDRFHAHGDRLYRVMRNVALPGQPIQTWPPVPKPLADVLARDYPEVEHAVLTTWPEELLVSRGQQTTREKGYHVGPAFFEVFSFPLLSGDPRTVLAQPDAIAISERLARKHFGAANPVGQVLKVDGLGDFRVAGVFADVPRQSSFQLDFALPMAEFVARNTWVEDWDNTGLRLYVRLREGTNVAAFDAKLAAILRANKPEGYATAFLQPFGDQHLYGQFENGQVVGGRIEYVRAFAIAAGLILLLACINFMNLATARAAMRAREVGVRKAIGAARAALVGQFLG
ncbi:MAG TPA: ABC transporter permease, partial [Rhodothermales bacterium]|nr:ABC transporter permease [Rhodothermales bacterium]